VKPESTSAAVLPQMMLELVDLPPMTDRLNLGNADGTGVAPPSQRVAVAKAGSLAIGVSDADSGCGSPHRCSLNSNEHSTWDLIVVERKKGI